MAGHVAEDKQTIQPKSLNDNVEHIWKCSGLTESSLGRRPMKWMAVEMRTKRRTQSCDLLEIDKKSIHKTQWKMPVLNQSFDRDWFGKEAWRRERA